MIRCCRFARLADAGKDELLLLAVALLEMVTAALAVMAEVSLRSTSGYVRTVSKLQSDSESDPETEAGDPSIDRGPFSRSAR